MGFENQYIIRYENHTDSEQKVMHEIRKYLNKKELPCYNIKEICWGTLFIELRKCNLDVDDFGKKFRWVSQILSMYDCSTEWGVVYNSHEAWAWESPEIYSQSEELNEEN